MTRVINGTEYPDDLHGANLVEADLRWANLSETDLYGANLFEADLRWANLHGANLSGADLHGANLSEADLHGANLSEANLSWADLSNTDLSGANLRGADLAEADLRGADLAEADLRGADLRGADVQMAKLSSAIDIPQTVYDTTLITPEGDIIGYKKLANGVICKLLIPAGAKRHNATGRKCRAEYAVVLEGEGHSRHDASFIYKTGETVRPIQPFDDDRWNECGEGIHFFLTRGEAEAY